MAKLANAFQLVPAWNVTKKEVQVSKVDYLNCWFDCFPNRIKHDASQHEYSSRIILGGEYNCIITFEQANQGAPNTLFTCMCGIN